MDMNYNTSISQEDSDYHHPIVSSPQVNQMQTEESKIDLVLQGTIHLNDQVDPNKNTKMNYNAFIDPESSDSHHYSRALGTQIHQTQTEEFKIDPVHERRTLFDDRGHQDFVLHGLPLGFDYRGRTISRGNALTACSLSPISKVPQSPVEDLLTTLSSTKSKMSIEQMLDQLTDDEGNMNEFPEAIPKSPKNVDDVDGQENQAVKGENNLEAN